MNLFEIEEEQFQRNTVDGSDGTRNNLTRKSSSSWPVFLTDKISEESKKQSRPFYSRKDCLNSRIDEKLKINMDKCEISILIKYIPVKVFAGKVLSGMKKMDKRVLANDLTITQELRKKRKRDRRRKDCSDNKPTERRSEERKRRAENKITLKVPRKTKN